jgi:UDP-2,3-diacylglucosamine hydrolase
VTAAAQPTVLGTPVFDCGGDDRPALLVSDLHVTADGGEVVANLQRALAWAVATGARLFVLGDLFDTFVSPAQLRVGVWRDVAARLAATAAQGVPIVVLHGNRDFLLGAEFAEAASAQVVPGGVRCAVGGRRVLMLHGDELCQNDLPYQRAKRWLRSPPVRFLARGLPLGFALRMAERARRRSRQVVATGDPARFDPTEAAVSAAFDLDVDLLVFGHIHRLVRGRLGEGEFCVLPAFDAARVVLAIDGAGARFLEVAGDGLVAATAVPELSLQRQR